MALPLVRVVGGQPGVRLVKPEVSDALDQGVGGCEHGGPYLAAAPPKRSEPGNWPSPATCSGSGTRSANGAASASGRATDETELHEKVLGTLPLHDWMTFAVTALNPHANDPGRDDAAG
ncbi:muconolactone Delta-isomerase family protein [Actinoallomurus sp. NPDC052274]|uniref:muconolactone Delta-isomerase family protein n=1 Tax=Actinoallomurus sp. NPDC052274 TaxID=3155420 RepID=UPI00341A60BD